jgi:hypothetical protein
MNPVFAAFSDFLNGWLLGTLFFGLIFGAFLSGALRGWQSRHWPATGGTVEESFVRECERTSESSINPTILYEPVVRYRYEVNGEKKESRQIGFLGVRSTSEAAAEKVIAKYPKEAKVTVYYHPKLPHLAVLEPGRWIGAFLCSIVTGAVFLGVGAIWWGKSTHPAAGKPHWHKPSDDARSADPEATSKQP